jgi:hypothetical protein
VTETQSLEAVEPAFEKEFAAHGEQLGATDVSPYEPAGHWHALRINTIENASVKEKILQAIKLMQAYPTPLAGEVEVPRHNWQVSDVLVGMPPNPDAHLLQ